MNSSDEPSHPNASCDDIENRPTTIADPERRSLAVALVGLLGGATLSACTKQAGGRNKEVTDVTENALSSTSYGTSIQWCDTYVELRNLVGGSTSMSKNVAVVRGSATDIPAAGGGGVFVWSTDTSTADDGGTLIARSTSRTGCWKRLYSGPVDVRWFGAKGDGATPCEAAVLAAATVAEGGSILFSAGTYKLSASLTIPCGVQFANNAMLAPASGTALAIQGTVLVSQSSKIFSLPSTYDPTIAIGLSACSPINVRWFGAGDGSTPDSTAIQAALQAGRAVYFPAGTYSIVQEIVVPDATSLEGDGWSSQIQLLASAPDYQNIFISGSSCTFRGLHLIGDNRTSCGPFDKSNGIYANGKSNITISECFIEQCTLNGIQLCNCQGAEILNNRLFSNPYVHGSAADITFWSSDLTTFLGRRTVIQGNHCLSNNSQGMNIDTLGCEADLIVSDNVCVTLDPLSCTATGRWVELEAGVYRRHGILVSYGSSQVNGPRCIVSGNLCRNTAWTGICKEGVSAGPVVIANNVCSKNGLDQTCAIAGGIYIQQSGHELVTGNSISEYKNHGNMTGGITINAGAAPTAPSTILGNTVRGSAGYGIYAANGCALLVINNNVLTDNVASDICWGHNGAPGGGGHLISGNTITRTSGAQVPAIGLYPQGDNLGIVVRDNEIRGNGSTSSAAMNAGIYWQGGTCDGNQVVGNRITGFYYGYSVNCDWYYSDWPSREIVIERNVIRSCVVGFSIGSSRAEIVVPLVDNVFIDTPAKASDAQLGAIVGYVCKMEGGRLVIETQSSPPTVGTWIQGDRCHFANPVAGGSIGAVCVSPGSPGVWKAFGGIAS